MKYFGVLLANVFFVKKKKETSKLSKNRSILIWVVDPSDRQLGSFQLGEKSSSEQHLEHGLNEHRGRVHWKQQVLLNTTDDLIGQLCVCDTEKRPSVNFSFDTQFNLHKILS